MLKKKNIIIVISAFFYLFALVSCGAGKSKDLSKPAESWEDITIFAQETVVPQTAACPEYTIIDRTQYDLSKFARDAEGFYILFDGKTFNGWRGYNRDDVPSRWVIDDESIKITGRVRTTPPGGATGGPGIPARPLTASDSLEMARAREAMAREGGDLIFGLKFKNFELSIDWKCSMAANSGIFYLGQEIKGEPLYISAPESQVLDNENHRDATMGVDGNRTSSSLYDMIPANPQNANPFDEWNNTTIIVNNGHIVHKQNGEKVVEYHAYTPQWTELLQISKFSQESWPLAFELLNNLGGKNREGYIGLQDHGNDVWFRNIKIKILE